LISATQKPLLQGRLLTFLSEICVRVGKIRRLEADVAKVPEHRSVFTGRARRLTRVLAGSSTGLSMPSFINKRATQKPS
jgi:hypothetical protein